LGSYKYYIYGESDLPVKTTVILNDEVYEWLVRKFGRRRISEVINRALMKEPQGPYSSALHSFNQMGSLTRNVWLSNSSFSESKISRRAQFLGSFSKTKFLSPRMFILFLAVSFLL